MSKLTMAFLSCIYFSLSCDVIYAGSRNKISGLTTSRIPRHENHKDCSVSTTHTFRSYVSARTPVRRTEKGTPDTFLKLHSFPRVFIPGR